MKKLVNTIIGIITVISLYIICNVGLGLFWTIGYLENPEKINVVLINISYSYIAGLIFYLFVTYLPYAIRQQKFNPIIKNQIDRLYNQINSCVQTFENTNKQDILSSITSGQLSELIAKNDLYKNSFYAQTVDFTQNNFNFLCKTREQIFNIINHLLICYGDYMTSQQICITEKIREAIFFNLINVYEDSPQAKLIYSSSEFKENLATELFSVIENARKLKNNMKTFNQ